MINKLNAESRTSSYGKMLYSVSWSFPNIYIYICLYVYEGCKAEVAIGKKSRCNLLCLVVVVVAVCS